jgi:hypothetical protein
MTRSHDEDGRIGSRYYYRRDLTAGELLGPVAIGAGVGLAVFYLARLIEQRTSLAAEERPRGSRRDRGAARPNSPGRA